MAFYNRVGWRDDFLELGPGVVLSQEQIAAVREKHPLKSVHDLCYLPPKHLEKMIGKEEVPLMFERVAALSPEHLTIAVLTSETSVSLEQGLPLATLQSNAPHSPF